MKLWPWSKRSEDPVPIVLYTREGCGLCEEMKEVLARTPLPRAYSLSEVDITEDPELLAAYELSIPVLTIAGRVAFKGRLDADSLRRKFVRITKQAEEAR